MIIVLTGGKGGDYNTAHIKHGLYWEVSFCFEQSLVIITGMSFQHNDFQRTK